MKPSIATKIKFICWAITIIILFAYFIRTIFIGFPLNTNVLDLLPKSNDNPVTASAVDNFSQTMGNQLIFLVGNPNKALAQEASDNFYQGIKHNKLFKKITYKINSQEQQAWASFYFPYRMSLLTKHQQTALQNNQANKIIQAAIFNLYNPMGVTNTELIKKDPFFLFQKFITSIPKPASKIELVNQKMMVQSDGVWYVMLNVQLSGDSFSISNQDSVVNAINLSKSNMLKLYPKTTLLDTGMLFYAKAGADDAQHDISTIGIGSIIGIILLILLTFRSLSPLLLILFSSAMGFVAAFAITHLIFGEVYLFTLIFGASLIGISVDYAFFYYAEQLLGGKNWTSQKGLKNIFSGITLGLINIILAYIVISFTPFPGLQQLAVFAVVGLSMAYATVVCFFPIILNAKKYNFTPPLLKITNQYLAFWQRLSTTQISIIYIIILMIALTGIYQVKANDNIKILQSVPAQLKQNEKDIKHIIGSTIGTNFFVIEGNTPEQTLLNENQLTQKIDQNFPHINQKYIAINAYIPTIQSQQENFNLIQTKLIKNNLLPYLHKIGVANDTALQIKKNLENTQFQALTVQDWVASPVSKSLRFLWLGNIQQKYVTILLLSNKLDAKTLQSISKSTPGVTYVNKANDISKIFKTYRIKLSILLVIAYLLLLLLLTLKYSFKRSWLYFLPPACASLLGLSVLGWFGIPLTLFNVLALILVLGIGVDYVLFFAETKSTYQSTMLATSLSAITTILSFGLLALSSTPAIAYFGLTVLVGIGSAFLLAPLAIRIKPKHENHHDA